MALNRLSCEPTLGMFDSEISTYSNTFPITSDIVYRPTSNNNESLTMRISTLAIMLHRVLSSSAFCSNLTVTSMAFAYLVPLGSIQYLAALTETTRCARFSAQSRSRLRKPLVNHSKQERKR